MNWALIYFSCFRVCIPQYVELYATKAECESHIPTAGKSMLALDNRPVCVPTVTGGKK